MLEKLGFTNVQAVISSGNVVFESQSKDAKVLEDLIENAWPEQLGFTSTTIIRSREELLDLIAKNPFKGLEHNRQNYLIVTFFKNKPEAKFEFPYQPENKSYKLLGLYDRAICSVVDTSATKTPDVMAWLERQFGKQITTRTYKTVHRILKKMDDT